jgi:hypothetical protein
MEMLFVSKEIAAVLAAILYIISAILIWKGEK